MNKRKSDKPLQVSIPFSASELARFNKVCGPRRPAKRGTYVLQAIQMRWEAEAAEVRV